jgi:hypothetical protein
VNIQASQFGDVMERLKKAAKDGLVKPKIGTLDYQAGKLLERCEKLTPPHKGYEQGVAAIKKDLAKITSIAPLEYLQFCADNFGTKNVRKEYRKKGGQKYLVEYDYIGFTVQELQAFHRKRMLSNGRVSNAGMKTRDIGRWIARDVIFIPPQIFEAYLAKLTKDIGKAKAGWLAGIFGTGAKKPDDFVTRQAMKEGRYVNGLSAARPFVEARNLSRWAKTRDEGERIMRSALKSRIRDMEKHFRLSCQKAKTKAITGT